MEKSNQKYQKYSQIVAKAWANPDFENKLMANPAETLKKEGFTLSSGVNVHVVKNTAKDFYFVIPTKPDQSELSADELKEIAGGAGPGWCLCSAGTIEIE